MKAPILSNYISFGESLTCFAMDFSEQGNAIPIINDLHNKGFDYALSKTHGATNSKCVISLVLYHNYLSVIIESGVCLIAKYFDTFGEWRREDMSPKDIHLYAHELFNNNGFFFKALEDGSQRKCEVFVENVDFDELLKRKAERLISKKPYVIYRPNDQLKKLDKITTYLKGHSVAFSTRKEFYTNVLQEALPDDFKKYDEKNKYSFIRSVSFKRYWDLFKPDDCIDVEEDDEAEN